MIDRSSLKLRVLTPDGLIFEREDLKAINISLGDGAKIGIRPNHAPLIAETASGKVKFRSDLEENEINLHPGVLDIRDNTVTIFTAGKVTDRPSGTPERTITEYERLMKTIVNKLTT